MLRDDLHVAKKKWKRFQGVEAKSVYVSQGSSMENFSDLVFVLELPILIGITD